MSIMVIILLGFGLAMDCLAVSIAEGTACKNMQIRHSLRMAFMFGLFQGFMPVLGWLTGMGLREYIQAYDHWIAFGLLGGIGGKMIYEAFKLEEIEKKSNVENFRMVILLAMATSIDALAVGVTLSLLGGSILTASIVIGAITFGVSCVGVAIGSKIGHLFENKAEIVAGVVLIGIGIKILLEHLIQHR